MYGGNAQRTVRGQQFTKENCSTLVLEGSGDSSEMGRSILGTPRNKFVKDEPFLEFGAGAVVEGQGEVQRFWGGVGTEFSILRAFHLKI